MGLVFVPITLMGTSGVSADDAGLASGLFNTAQQVGGSLGLAILSTLAASQTSHLLSSHSATKVAATVSGYHVAFLAAAMMFAAATVLLVVRAAQAPPGRGRAGDRVRRGDRGRRLTAAHLPGRTVPDVTMSDGWRRSRQRYEPRRLRADAQRNRRRLIEAATELFSERGLDVGVADIAARAGVGRGTLFRNFPSKEHLIAAIVVERMRESIARAREALERRRPGDGAVRADRARRSTARRPTGRCSTRCRTRGWPTTEIRGRPRARC